MLVLISLSLPFSLVKRGFLMLLLLLLISLIFPLSLLLLLMLSVCTFPSFPLSLPLLSLSLFHYLLPSFPFPLSLSPPLLHFFRSSLSSHTPYHFPQLPAYPFPSLHLFFSFSIRRKRAFY